MKIFKFGIVSLGLFLSAMNAQALEFRAKHPLDQPELAKIWDNSCRISLATAIQNYGSKVSFPTKRDKMVFVASICARIAKDDAEDIAKTDIPLALHACYSIVGRTGIVVGFEKPMEAKGNNYEFAKQYCDAL